MDTVVIRAEEDPLTGLDAYDARQLLDLGNESFAAKAFDRAVKLYERLLDEFPDSDVADSARYNLGLSFEGLAEWAQAARAFEGVIASHPDPETRVDAHFRLAYVFAKSERWQDAADTLYTLRVDNELEFLEELEAWVDMSVALFMNGDYATAERELMRALSFHEKNARSRFIPSEHWVGKSRFYLGMIYVRWFEEETLSEPVDPDEEDAWVAAMSEELEEKCRLLLRAQSNFIRTIRVGHTGWATAAGYEIGKLYETLYDQMIEAPVPESLSEEAKQVYREELQSRVKVLVVKAIKVYEMSKEMAERVGEQNQWVERTKSALERMKSLYLASSEARAEET